MTQLTDNGIFSIQIPLDATDIVLHNDPPKLVFSSAIQDPAQCGGDIIALSPGSYEFLFCTHTATEKEADSIVERRTDLKDHPHKGYEPGKLTACWNAIDSLHSLLRSKGCEGNHAIIKKLNP
jgi:hypothetical protein